MPTGFLSLPMPTRCAVRVPALIGTVLALVFFLGCSASRAPAPETSPANDAPAGPAIALLYTTASDALLLHDAQMDTTDTLARGVRYNAARALDPDRQRLAFSYATADSTHLAIFNLRSFTLRHVHAAPAPTTYSLAWHPTDGRLAVGHYTPTREGDRGAGGVRIALPDGTTRSVGCRAVREVLHWLPSGALAGRDDDTLYLVDPADCATQAATDARRMNHLAYAPDGRHLAYIHYELTYNRTTGEYEPDSSLYLSNPQGENAKQLFSADRRVRHLRWTSDGSELAFDAQLDTTDRRQIVIYNATTDRTVYLIPPEAAPEGDQLYPRWSPSGTTVGFIQRSPEGTIAAARVQGQTRRFGHTTGPVEWVDDQTLVVPGPDSLRVKALNNDAVHTQPAPGVFIHAWRRPAPQ